MVRLAVNGEFRVICFPTNFFGYTVQFLQAVRFVILEARRAVFSLKIQETLAFLTIFPTVLKIPSNRLKPFKLPK